MAAHYAATVFSMFSIKSKGISDFKFDVGTWTYDWVNEKYSVSSGTDYVASLNGSSAYTDVDLSVTMRYDASPTSWGGVNFRKASPTSQPWADGYLVYLTRSSGNCIIHLYKATTGVDITSYTYNSVDPLYNDVKLRISAQGSSIKVFVDSNLSPVISVTDTAYTSGYVGLAALDAATTFSKFKITTTGSITGKLKNNSGSPISGATVRGQGIPSGITTDANGIYEIWGLPTGTYSLSFRADGYRDSYNNSVTIASNSRFIVSSDITLSDVSSSSASFSFDVGDWYYNASTYTSDTSGSVATYIGSKYFYTFDVTFTVRIAFADYSSCGLNFWKKQKASNPWDDGYLVFLSDDGHLKLFKGINELQNVSTGKNPVSNNVVLRVVVNSSNNVKVYADSTLYIDYNLPNKDYGYINLASNWGNVTFSSFTLSSYTEDNAKNYYSATPSSANLTNVSVDEEYHAINYYNNTTAASSSLENSNYGKAYASNGTASASTQYGWTSDGNTGSNHTEWYKIDMGQRQFIDRIDLYPLNDQGGYIGEYFPVDYLVQFAVIDNPTQESDWVTVVNKTNSSAITSYVTYRIAPQAVRHIRIKGTTLRSGRLGYKMQLGDVLAYYENYRAYSASNATTNQYYYISSSGGSDSNNGTSSATPWKTLTKAASLNYSAGNRILLKCGDTWTDETLMFSGSGTSANPIIISSYSTGNKPIIKAGNGAAHGIKVFNQSGIKIDGIEFSNSVFGVTAVADRTLNNDYLFVDNCNFHDLEMAYAMPDSSNYKVTYAEAFAGTGVTIMTANPAANKGKTLYKNITIEDSTFTKCDTGIFNTTVGYPMALDGTFDSGHLNFGRNTIDTFLIQRVTITQSYRSGGIMMYATTNGTIDNTTIDQTGYQKGMWWGVCAMQLAYCENTTVKNSEFKNTILVSGMFDGEGVDFESGNKNVTVYNTYIHDNAGPAILFYGDNAGWYSDNTGIVVDSCNIENNGIVGTNDHSKVFKNYSKNEGIIKNCRIKLKFESQAVSNDPLDYSGTNTVIDPDGNVVSGGGLTYIKDSDPAVQYTGRWARPSDSKYYYGQAHISKGTSDSAEFSFYGTTFRLYGTKSSTGGNTSVYIDDALDSSSVSFYNASESNKQLIYEKTGLSAGNHKFKIVRTSGEMTIEAFNSFVTQTPDNTRVNLALAATVTSSSTVETTGYSLQSVKDGERTNFKEFSRGWVSNNSLSQQSHDEWVQFDFGSSKSFDTVDLYPGSYGLYSWGTTAANIGNFFPLDFKIQTSDNGSTWTDIKTKTGYSLKEIHYDPNDSSKVTKDERVRFMFDTDKSARYVRILGTKFNNVSSEYRMHLAEVEIFNHSTDSGYEFNVGDWYFDAGTSKYSCEAIADSVATKKNSAGTADSDKTFTVQYTGTPTWGGMNFRKASKTSAPWSDGYLVYAYADGVVHLYSYYDGGDLGTYSTGSNPVTTPITIRTKLTGTHIQVYVNGHTNPDIDVYNSRYSSGYYGLASSSTESIFTNVP